MNVGILALQGAFAAHEKVLSDLGASVTRVKTPAELSTVDAVVLPGGESTTMSMLLDSSGLREPLEVLLRHGFPVFGTCAGLIMLSSDIKDGRSDQRPFGALGISVRRNGYGRQIDSFETPLVVDDGAQRFEMNGVFIRAPRIEEVDCDVEVLAEVNNDPVLVRQGNVLGATFHPELGESGYVHQLFLEIVAKAQSVPKDFTMVRN
ncbi:MAG: pyridoxal 5'-phosphate synthase glutaminase subunit PdxT [Ilumatobacteraceae bacterium]|nr:pyridoxal 5'-phosphate synthase glutaminase subunit PdxT [Actinomycetota bacterium]